MIHTYSIPSRSHLLSPLKTQHYAIHPQINLHSLICYLLHVYCMEINFFVFISDYSLITYLHIFVYELAKITHIYLPFQSIVHISYILYIHLSWTNLSLSSVTKKYDLTLLLSNFLYYSVMNIWYKNPQERV